MRLGMRLGIAAVALVALGGLASAQHQHGGHQAAAHAPDTRQFVQFPPALVEGTLANMRDHLLALQEIQLHLGMGHNDVAAKIAEKAPVALQLCKEAVKFASRSNLDEGLRREVDLFAICFSTEDKQEGVSAFLEKRKADFKGK